MLAEEAMRLYPCLCLCPDHARQQQDNDPKPKASKRKLMRMAGVRLLAGRAALMVARHGKINLGYQLRAAVEDASM